jgi:hypothetical protein
MQSLSAKKLLSRTENIIAERNDLKQGIMEEFGKS